MSVLASARKTHQYDAPIRMILHGPPGVGKSSFAASAPSPIFIAAEDGLASIDATSLPEPDSWETVCSQLDALANEEHGYKTVVIDSLDWLEPIIWDYVCRRGGKSNIAQFEFGKGYVAAQNEWRVLMNRLSLLRRRGMHIVLIAHSVRKTVANPEGADFDAWLIKLHEKAAGALIEWVDVVGYASHEIALKAVDGTMKAIGTGHRELRVRPHPAFTAKTRLHLPESMPLDWETFATECHRAKGVAEAITGRIGVALESAAPELAARVHAAVEKANGDPARLQKILDHLNNKKGTST